MTLGATAYKLSCVFAPCDDRLSCLGVEKIKGFADAVEGIAPCRATAEDGVALMKILDAIYESAETGKSVEIKSL